MRVMGIDVGKSCTGIAILDSSGFRTASFDFKTTNSYLQTLKQLIRQNKPDLVVYSDTVMMMRRNSVKPLHFLMCLVELACEQCDTALMVVSDAEAKKSIVGAGNAKKPDVAKAMKEYIDSDTQDILDAGMFALHAIRLLKNREE